MVAFEKQEADQIYAEFKEKLEAEHFGKIVAVDTDSGGIAGIGGTRRKRKPRKPGSLSGGPDTIIFTVLEVLRGAN